MLEVIKHAATEHNILTTLVGVDVDFDGAFTDQLLRVHGASCFSVHSSRACWQYLGEELDYRVSPCAFDVQLCLEGPPDFKTGHGTHFYGIRQLLPPEPWAAGVLCQASLFPAPADARGQTRGSLLLCRLPGRPPCGQLQLVVSYAPSGGGPRTELAEEVDLNAVADPASLKGIALVRFVNIVRGYLGDMRAMPPTPSLSLLTGLWHPPHSGVYADNSKAMRETERREALLAEAYVGMFAAVRAQLEAVQADLEALGDPDADLSQWCGKLLALERSCRDFVETYASTV